MDKTVKELEEEIRQTKRKNAEDSHLKSMKELNTVPTEYKCSRCDGMISRLDTEGTRPKAFCLCSFASDWFEHLCKICGQTVEVVVSYRYWDGHRGHTVEQGRFKVVDFTDTTPKEHFRKVLICNDCIELNDLEWRKQVKDQEEVVRRASQKVGWKETEVMGSKNRVKMFKKELKVLVGTLEEETTKLVELKDQGDG